MKRVTVSVLISAAMLIAGCAVIWFFIVGPRLKAPPPPAPIPAPVVQPKPVEHRSVLNVYLTAPETLPSGAVSAELTLVKAAIVDGKGAETPVFTGVQRVMLQAGVIQKVLSEPLPEGSWKSLKLEFSEAALFSMSDRSVVSAMLGRRQAVLSFDADLPASNSLALFARFPLDPNLIGTGEAHIANLLTEPRSSETHVFGTLLLDPRGRGDLWTVTDPSLAQAILSDIGLDIVTVLPGSQGFSPAVQVPETKTSP
jgi:hypothetical protein